MLHTKFHQNLPRSGKKIFKVFYHIWAVQPSWSCDLQYADGFSLTFYLQAYIQNLVENGPVVSEKSKLNLPL